MMLIYHHVTVTSRGGGVDVTAFTWQLSSINLPFLQEFQQDLSDIFHAPWSHNKLGYRDTVGSAGVQSKLKSSGFCVARLDFLVKYAECAIRKDNMFPNLGERKGYKYKW